MKILIYPSYSYYSFNSKSIYISNNSPHYQNIEVPVFSSHGIFSKNKNCNQITRKTNHSNDKNAHAFNPKTYSFSTNFHVFFKGFITLRVFCSVTFRKLHIILGDSSIVCFIRGLKERKIIKVILQHGTLDQEVQSTDSRQQKFDYIINNSLM